MCCNPIFSLCGPWAFLPVLFAATVAQTRILWSSWRSWSGWKPVACSWFHKCYCSDVFGVYSSLGFDWHWLLQNYALDPCWTCSYSSLSIAKKAAMGAWSTGQAAKSLLNAKCLGDKLLILHFRAALLVTHSWKWFIRVHGGWSFLVQWTLNPCCYHLVCLLTGSGVMLPVKGSAPLYCTESV